MVDSTTFVFHNAYIFVKLTHDNTQGNYKEDKNCTIKDNNSLIFASMTIPIICLNSLSLLLGLLELRKRIVKIKSSEIFLSYKEI